MARPQANEDEIAPRRHLDRLGSGDARAHPAYLLSSGDGPQARTEQEQGSVRPCYATPARWRVSAHGLTNTVSAGGDRSTGRTATPPLLTDTWAQRRPERGRFAGDTGPWGATYSTMHPLVGQLGRLRTVCSTHACWRTTHPSAASCMVRRYVGTTSTPSIPVAASHPLSTQNSQGTSQCVCCLLRGVPRAGHTC